MALPRSRDVIVYALLCLLAAGFVSWQWVDHQRYRTAARQRLVTILRNMSHSLEIFLRAQCRRGGIIPREPLEGALAAFVENGPMRAVAVYNSRGEVIARAGPEPSFAAGPPPPGTTQWSGDSLTLVQLVQLGRLQSRPPDKAAAEDGDEELLILDRETAHRLMREFFARHHPPASLTDGDGIDIEAHRERMRQYRGEWRGSLSPEVLQEYGLNRLVLTISQGPIAGHVRRDLWMRGFLSALFGLALAALGWGWHTSRRSAQLNLELVRTQEQNRHLQELNLAAAGLAHETKNPLNVIRGLAQTVRAADDVPAVAREDAELLMTEVDAVTSRLNEFIEYSRPRQPRPQPVAIRTVLEAVGRVLQIDLKEKSVTYDVMGDQPVVEADPEIGRAHV